MSTPVAASDPLDPGVRPGDADQVANLVGVGRQHDVGRAREQGLGGPGDIGGGRRGQQNSAPPGGRRVERVLDDPGERARQPVLAYWIAPGRGNAGGRGDHGRVVAPGDVQGRADAAVAVVDRGQRAGVEDDGSQLWASINSSVV